MILPSVIFGLLALVVTMCFTSMLLSAGVEGLAAIAIGTGTGYYVYELLEALEALRLARKGEKQP